MQQLYLELRLHVDPVVILRSPAIDVLLPVLAHHDDWRGVGRLERKREIEKNERVGVPAPDRAHQVGRYPDDQNRALDDDEAPRSHDGRDRVRYPLPRRQARDRRRLIYGLKPKRTARSPEVGEQVVLSRLHATGVSRLLLHAASTRSARLRGRFRLCARLARARNHHVADVSAFCSSYLTSTPFQKAT